MTAIQLQIQLEGNVCIAVGDCRMMDKCPHDHDPKMKGSDDPSAMTIAKGIKCRNHPGCKFGEDCIYSHE